MAPSEEGGGRKTDEEIFRERMREEDKKYREMAKEFEDRLKASEIMERAANHSNNSNYHDDPKNKDSGNESGAGGHKLSPKSFKFVNLTTNMMEAGISGLVFRGIEVVTGITLKEVAFPTLYIEFPSETKDGTPYSPLEASRITAEVFNDAALVTVGILLTRSQEERMEMKARDISNIFVAQAQILIRERIKAESFIIYRKFGTKTITTPAVWE